MTITGCGFTGATAVNFGATAATAFTVNTDASISATSPAHAAGTVDVTVTTPSGTSATAPADQFTYQSANAHCTSAAVSANPASPQAVGSQVSFTGSSTGCPSPVYEFWLRTPDGMWHMVQPFDGNVWNWNTSTYGAGTYTIHVWANNAGDSQTTFEAFGEAFYTLTATPGRCTSAGLGFTGPASRPAGSTVDFTATSTGCAFPMYEYWVGDSSGNWTLTRPFTNDPTWTWDTRGWPAGTYTIHVWANEGGDSTASFEAYGSAMVTLTGCASASLSPAAPTQEAGSTVAFSASATGCADPMFEFWVQDLNGNWHLMRPFTSDPTWNWDTSGLTPGTYTVHVWANEAGDSTSRFEAFGSSTVTLTGCSSASLAPVNPSAAAGSTVSLTASSAGCSNPQYEFWVMYPDGTWHLIQGFGGATFNWNTIGLAPGSYLVHVWANQTGASTARYEAFGSDTVTLTGCTSAALSPTNGSAAVGTAVTFTASSAGCPTAVYEFWLEYPDGTWHLEQGFSTTATWTWNTAGFPKGNYVIHVWANNQNSSYSTYETFGAATYTLT